jgi:lysophospholipase L1-like esterase
LTTPSREPPAGAPKNNAPKPQSRLAAVAVTIASAVVVVTCGTAREQAPPPVTPPALTSSAPSALMPEPSAIPSTTSVAAPPLEVPAAAASAEPVPAPQPQLQGPLPRTPGHELDNFHAALRDLEKHTRKEHVRVAWLGDSHGASDFWSGALRTALQKRFGNGGPGFVNVGHKGYRHDGVRMDIGGTWRPRPKGASTTIPSGDGIFGLGGFLMIGQEGGPRTLLTLPAQDPPLPTSLSWDLCYKLTTKKDEIEVKVNGISAAKLPSAGEARGALSHHVFTSKGADTTFAVVPTAGYPELCGVVIEADPASQAGVVVDTLGINGARLATPLAWNEASWVSELSRRVPSLVILEYGTNESGDYKIDPLVYTRHLTDVMARVRKASARSDCLVLAPTDRADTRDRTPLVRDALEQAAGAVGCRFWDTYKAMGGQGSILTWRSETPPRAAGDGVHLTMRGYRELGGKLATDVLSGYTP